jgi:DNA-directed RNA polymerase subunit beta'
MVEDKKLVAPGDVLAKKPVEKKRTRDIVGGLPRVVELFEARRPKEPAVITQVSGIVRHAGTVKGQQKVTVESEDGQKWDVMIPRGVHVMIQDGERVESGDPLTEGDPSPHDILAVKGEKELQRYMTDKIQEVYRSQGVGINDKHIEVIVRQMMRSVRIEEVGDTEFLVDEQVDKFRFQEENRRILEARGNPAQGRPLLLGITKASLSTDSFVSAASFQETTRVLTEASISGRKDLLRGLKENVIVGRLIPAGTGMAHYRNVVLEREEIPVEPEEDDDLYYEGETPVIAADFDDEV